MHSNLIDLINVWQTLQVQSNLSEAMQSTKDKLEELIKGYIEALKLPSNN